MGVGKKLKDGVDEFVKEDVGKFKLFISNPMKYIKPLGNKSIVALIIFIIGSFLCMLHSDYYGDTGTTVIIKILYFILGYRVLVHIYEAEHSLNNNDKDKGAA